jgi:uncharacterized membrane protein YjjB (DUF3815 family)
VGGVLGTTAARLARPPRAVHHLSVVLLLVPAGTAARGSRSGSYPGTR